MTLKEALKAKDFALAKTIALGELEQAFIEGDVQPLGPPPAKPKRKICKNLYLPVEVAARELKSKAWLAGKMARRGWDVVIGASWNLLDYRYTDWPPGVVLFKTLNGLDAKGMWTAIQAGHQIAAMSEEMFAQLPADWFYRAEIEPGAIQLADLLCAPSEESAKVLRDLYPDADIQVTGNPRTLVTKGRGGGDKILVCLFSGNTNGSLPFKEYMKIVFDVLGKAVEGDIIRLMRELVSHELEAMPLVWDTIEKLKETYPGQVVVRAHPVEDKTTWKVDDDGTLPFMEALDDAGCIVCVSGCGTGVEAALAGVPVVRLGSGGHGLSARCGVQADTAGDAVVLVGAALAGNGRCGADDLFAPVKLPEALEALYRKNKFDWPGFDMHLAYSQRSVPLEINEFMTNKFSDVSDEEMSRLVGLPVERVAWNLWWVRALRDGKSARPTKALEAA